MDSPYANPSTNANRRTRTARFACSFLLTFALLVGGVGCMQGGTPGGDTTPPGNVTAFSAAAGDAQVVLTWTNPTDADLAGVKIVRKTGSAPTSPSDGTSVFSGNAQTTTDTGLSNGTTYYYAAFAFDGVPNYASGAQANALPTVATADRELLDEYASVRQATLGDLPNPAAQSIDDGLGQSEALYRAGDICGAASAALALLPAVQSAREAASSPDVLGAAEEIYNRSRMLRFAMLTEGSLATPCPGTERVGAEIGVTTDEVNSDTTQFIGDATFGEPRLLTVKANDEVFTQLEVPGANAQSGAPGDPAIPTLRRLLAVPQGVTRMDQIVLTVTPDDAEAIQLNLLPIQDFGRGQSAGGPPPMEVLYDHPAFAKNLDRYAPGAPPFPQDKGLLSPLGACRDMLIYQLEIPAGQFDPSTQTLTLFKRVNVNVQFIGGMGTFTTDTGVGPFDSIAALSNTALWNSSIVSRYPGAVISNLLNAGEELMILTHPKFLDAANTLADWKNKKGIVTNVYVVNDPNVPSDLDHPHTADEIKAYMLAHYRKVKMRPSYALLIGDAEFIPPHYLTSNLDPNSTICSDWPYSNMPPEGFLGIFDIFQDIAVGRIPVDTLDEANIYVNKVINYEHTPPVNSGFYNKVALCSQFQCCRKDTSAGYDQSLFIWPSEGAHDAISAKGYTVDRIYGESVDGGDSTAHPPVPAYTGDTTPRKYWDGTSIPSAIGPGSGFGWNGTATDVDNAWNDGRFLIMHVDHGWPGGWGTPGFNWNDVTYSLTNGELEPVLFSINCSSGYFDNEIVDTPNKDQVYFTERLIRYANGAVGVISSTRTSWIWPNAYQALGFVDSLFPATLSGFGDGAVHRRLGDILVHGNLYMFTQINATVDAAHAGDQIHMYHAFGDPTLEIWTSYPYHFRLPKDATVLLSTSKLSLSYATEGALLTAFQPDAAGGPPIPLGRGTVKDGVADLFLVGQPRQGASVTISAVLPDSIPELIPVTLPDITPPGNVFRFTATPGDTVVYLQWVNPQDSDFAGVRIQRKEGGYPTSPQDGTTVYEGNAENATDTGLTNATQYFYAIYSYDAALNYSSGVQDTATPHSL